MPLERPINPPEENECTSCGAETDNGSLCEYCEEEKKADFNED